MDGTGDLFRDFVCSLPAELATALARDPVDRHASREELLAIAEKAFPASEHFVIVAESYSTPLAIVLASAAPANLAGLILCAGFASSPIVGWRRPLARLAARAVFHLPLPRFVIRQRLLGSNAPRDLVHTVRAVLERVSPTVLAARLRDVLQCDVRSELARVAVPILYLEAFQNRLLPKSALDEILRIRPELKVVKINAPHLLLQREPGVAASAIADFVGSLG